jgi:2'-5' RNA ligase
MRSFLAFEIPPEVKAYLSQVSKAMAKNVPGVRWVRPEGQHITISSSGRYRMRGAGD